MDNQIQITEREWASDEYDGLAPTSNEIKGQEHIDLGYPTIEEFPYGYK
ncbi:MAG: hypothetical protein JKY18_09870 [Flavobacteriales bacterium]|nr:hypothetical protein [Flavobacteriales bacterium]